VGKEEKEIWPDGHVTWASTTKMPLRDSEGHITGTFGVSRDITGFKQAEESLRESEERFRSLVENATVGIYRTTPDGQIVAANSTLAYRGPPARQSTMSFVLDVFRSSNISAPKHGQRQLNQLVGRKASTIF